MQPRPTPPLSTTVRSTQLLLAWRGVRRGHPSRAGRSGGCCRITELPHSAPSLRGVMNLRGAVVPRRRHGAALGLPDEGYGQFTVIIVLSVRGRTVGFVVDSVSDVLSLDESAIERAPELGGRVDASLVSGIGRTQERFVIRARRRIESQASTSCPRGRCEHRRVRNDVPLAPRVRGAEVCDPSGRRDSLARHEETSLSPAVYSAA